MDHDTHIGGAQHRFPLTQRSMIDAVRGDDPAVRERALHALITAYWKPIYKYIRMKWRASNEEAKDLAQGFFTMAMERGFVDRYAAQRASFRTYLRLGVDGYVANERKAAGRHKRGGGRRFVSLDFDVAEAEFLTLGPSADDEGAFFDRECLRSLFEGATHSLRTLCAASGKITHFTLFERYDLHGAAGGARSTYEQLADEFGLSVTQVTNDLAWARRTFRRCALDALRELSGSDEEFHDEAQRLLGIRP